MKKNIVLSGLFLLILSSFFAGFFYGPASVHQDIKKASAASPAVNDISQNEDMDAEESAAPGSVRVSSEKQQLMGVRLETVRKGPVSKTLRVLGRVAADENRVYRIVAAVDGWIRSVCGSTTGSIVEKDEILASFYSPEFLSAQQAYLYALGSLARFKTSGKETTQQLNLTALNIQQYKDTLSNLGMSDTQIEQIGQSRQYTENIQIRSPISGFVTFRNVSPGLRIDKGAEIYRIVDLQHVWILADIFENEAQYLKPGAAIKVIHPQLKKAFQAKVSSALPLFDPVTRTLKLRLEADNPGYALRPDMFVDLELPVTLSGGITVAADAVLDSGIRKTVYVNQGGGVFEPREVKTGRKLSDRVEIVEGLQEGERIAVSGNFLIDSESRTSLALNGIQRTTAPDPVCKQSVSFRKAERTGLKAVFGGKTYIFCSDECKSRFEKNPERYLTPIE